MSEFLHEGLHVLLDTTKTVPLLLLVYALLYYIDHRLTNTPSLLKTTAKFGPIVGAFAGTIPQCGFSAAASALFSAGHLAPATLIAVFIATSDEAVPVLISQGAPWDQVALLLVFKFLLAVGAGYLLNATVFRAFRMKLDPKVTVEHIDAHTHHDHSCGCEHGHRSPIATVLMKTLRTAAFLFAILLALDLAIDWIGIEHLSKILLSDTIFQPILCAVLGLIPSCAMSVLFAELFAAGTISFGSMIAGLSTGAGFGYIVLMQKKQGRTYALPIIAITLCFAIIGGIICQVVFPF